MTGEAAPGKSEVTVPRKSSKHSHMKNPYITAWAAIQMLGIHQQRSTEGIKGHDHSLLHTHTYTHLKLILLSVTICILDEKAFN